MFQVRPGLFETNSSSVHAIAYCTEEEFNRFLSGELVFDTENDALVPPDAEFTPCQFSYREFQRIQNEDYWDLRAKAELKTLSDGTKFGVIRYDKEE